MKRNIYIGALILMLVVALGVGSIVLEKRAAVQAAGNQAPMFEVDPMWPKPMPNHWVIGMTIGVSVDAQDNVWIIHRGGSLEAKETYANTTPPGADCCVTAPPVLEFDKAGNLIGHWGGPGAGYNPPNAKPIERLRFISTLLLSRAQSRTRTFFRQAPSGARTRYFFGHNTP